MEQKASAQLTSQDFAEDMRLRAETDFFRGGLQAFFGVATITIPLGSTGH